MASRTRRGWKPDSRGYYARQIGWKRSRTGKRQQHKFLLGTDRKEAEQRERKLRELWDRFEEGCSETTPLWPDDLLIVAKRIARGIPAIPIPRGPNEMQHHYAARIQRMQAKYPVVLFLPEDQHAYEIGQSALELFESIPVESKAVNVRTVDVDLMQALGEAKQRLTEAGVKFDSELAVLSVTDSETDLHPRLGTLRPSEPAAGRWRKSKSISPQDLAPPNSKHNHDSLPSKTPSATLHRAMRAYQKHLEREYHRPEMNQISAWGKTQVRQTQNLVKHHPDRLLTLLDADAVSEMIGYWRRRPCQLGASKPLTAKTCGNFLGTLVRFFKWLDVSSQFDWNKPFAFSDIDTRIRRLPSDHARKSLEQVETFTLDELRLLMRYGQPFERLLILLGLNCGFGRAEIASLLVGEIYLFQAHEPRHQEIMGFETTDEDSFIKRVRRKSGVYGEHILYPLTVQGIEWAFEQRRQFSEYSPESILILSQSGRPLDEPTKSGNSNQIIPNHFARLVKRIQDDGNEIRPLSFGKLRKTSTDLIKRYSNGEIAGVFDCHGTPVKSDSLSDQYSNRPFGKVFQAIREVQEYLAPVFAEANSHPFAPQAQAYTKRSMIDRIIQLYHEGYPTGQIAAAVKLSGMSVSRHIQQHFQQCERCVESSRGIPDSNESGRDPSNQMISHEQVKSSD